MQKIVSGQTRNLTLSQQGYEHLTSLLKEEKKSALRDGIIGMVFEVSFIVSDVIIWSFACLSGYQSTLFNSFLLVLTAFGLAMLLNGMFRLFEFKSGKRKLTFSLRKGDNYDVHIFSNEG
ncbi:MAG: hypothetical protein QXW80_06615 [Candidatus Micrarchaeia archaeon]